MHLNASIRSHNGRIAANSSLTPEEVSRLWAGWTETWVLEKLLSTSRRMKKSWAKQSATAVALKGELPQLKPIVSFGWCVELENKYVLFRDYCGFYDTLKLFYSLRLWSRTLKFQERPLKQQCFVGKITAFPCHPRASNEVRRILSRAWTRSASRNSYHHISDGFLACPCFKVVLSLLEPARQWLLSLLSPIPTPTKKKKKHQMLL